jgi:branched-chain amino acid transport system ATP-binding protein
MEDSGKRTMLEVERLHVEYDKASALSDVSFTVPRGSVMAVLGPNGSGKSTLAKAVSGLVKPSEGRVVFDGTDITAWPAYRIARAGLVHVPEGRGFFPGMSVIDNLRTSLRRAAPKDKREEVLERAFAYFPILKARARQQAGTLSGGEQQMLSLARVMAVPPTVLIADEMSLGLAPIIVETIFKALGEVRRDGVTVVLIEQFVERALAFADDVIILGRGEVRWSGKADDASSAVAGQYLGAGVA